MLCVSHPNDELEKNQNEFWVIELTISKYKALYSAQIWMDFCKGLPHKDQKEAIPSLVWQKHQHSCYYSPKLQ